jgi:hypothetical protein
MLRPLSTLAALLMVARLEQQVFLVLQAKGVVEADADAELAEERETGAEELLLERTDEVLEYAELDRAEEEAGTLEVWDTYNDADADDAGERAYQTKHPNGRDWLTMRVGTRGRM